MIAATDQNPARWFLFSSKACLLMIQTLFIIIVIVTKEEYLYRGLKTDVSTSSDAYKEANRETIISSALFFAFLFLEFLTVLTGVSTKFLGVTSFQVLLHFLGTSFTLWVIIERGHFRNITYIMVLFGFVPFVLEIGVLVVNWFIQRVQGNYVVKPGRRTHLSEQEIQKRKKREEIKRKQMRMKREKPQQPMFSQEDPLSQSRGLDDRSEADRYNSGYDSRRNDDYDSRDEPRSRVDDSQRSQNIDQNRSQDISLDDSYNR